MSTRLVSKRLFYLLPLAILAGFAEALAVPEGIGPGPHFGHAGSGGVADVLGWQVTSPVVGMGHGLTKPARVAPVPFAAAAGCRQVISDGGFERGASDVWRVGGPGIPSSLLDIIVLCGGGAYEGTCYAQLGLFRGEWMVLFQNQTLPMIDPDEISLALLKFAIKIDNRRPKNNQADVTIQPCLVQYVGGYRVVPFNPVFSDEESDSFHEWTIVESQLDSIILREIAARSTQFGFMVWARDQEGTTRFHVDAVSLELCEGWTPSPTVPSPTSEPMATFTMTPSPATTETASPTPTGLAAYLSLALRRAVLSSARASEASPGRWESESTNGRSRGRGFSAEPGRSRSKA